ncbi:MAG: magnesium/cobalt transporter CorA [Chloroflexota bacterium]|nr:magnesium/cobalt transporter CorA [Chloroflexota bacterium]
MTVTQIALGCPPLADLATEAVQECVLQPNGAVPLWLDVQDPTDDDLDYLARTFSFHPMALDDCRHVDQHSKLVEYEGYLFLSMAIPHHSADQSSIEIEEVQAFLGRHYLVTVHQGSLGVLSTVPGLFAKEPGAPRKNGALHRQADFLLYILADQLVDGYFPLLDTMDDQMDQLEDEILEEPTQAMLHRLFTLKQQLVLLRKVAGPLREAMNAMADHPYPEVRRSTSLYFRNVYDHLTRVYEIIETSRDLLGNAMDAYLSMVSNRLSEVMKRLTLVTTIFMPISFVVGFGGMNFTRFVPFEETWAFAIVLTALLVMPTGMILWFRRSKWL